VACTERPTAIVAAATAAATRGIDVDPPLVRALQPPSRPAWASMAGP
jgi:hypothetical protein